MLLNTLLACTCLCVGIAYAPETRSFIERRSRAAAKRAARRRTFEEGWDDEEDGLLLSHDDGEGDAPVDETGGAADADADADADAEEIRSVLGATFLSYIRSTPFTVIWVGATLNTGCTMLEELSPLYMKTDSGIGGLSFSPRRIATVMMVGGIALLVWQLLVFERIIKRFGAVATMQAAMLIMVPVSLVQPVLGASFGDPQSRVLAQIVSFSGYQSLQAFVLGTCFPAWFILQNNSVSDAIKGRINGAAQTITNLLSMLAPLLAGTRRGLSPTRSLARSLARSRRPPPAPQDRRSRSR